MSKFSNYLDKTVKPCGCVLISELNVLENVIEEITIKICRSHYYYHTEKNNFTFSKSQNLYIYNPYFKEISTKMKKNKIPNENNKYKNNEVITFGKYKSKSFDYVYNNDKTYCYNLSFWRSDIPECDDIHLFISFVKSSLKV